MPMYTVSSLKPLPKPTRITIASLIMNVHCNLTGAPETFVNVVFSQNVPLKKGVRLNVFGNVRKGRTPKMNQELVSELSTQIQTLTDYKAHELQLSLFEVPASWVMEGGEVLPEPGEEDDCDWLKNSQANTANRQLT